MSSPVLEPEHSSPLEAHPRPATAPPGGWWHEFDSESVRPLDGGEELAGTGRTVLDFWRWAYSDLRMNTNRPILAEYLVSQALGCQQPVRTEWADCDAETPDGIRIEVKSSGYIQSWNQKRPSTITFGSLTGRVLDQVSGRYAQDPTIRAHVFVFAAQTCKVPSEYNALDVSQWDFYVMPACEVEANQTQSVGLAFVERKAKRLSLADLPEAVRSAHHEQLDHINCVRQGASALVEEEHS